MAIPASTTGDASLQRMQRPAGVTILGILNFIWGTLLGAACASLIFIMLKPTGVDSWGLRDFLARFGVIVAMVGLFVARTRKGRICSGPITCCKAARLTRRG
jgi:hypothetical protein